MRIGTWNLAGRWSDDHRASAQADCDVWLLTEVNERASLPGFAMHLSARRWRLRRWAAFAAGCRWPRAPTRTGPAQQRRSARRRTSARCCRGERGSGPVWVGERHADKTQNAVDDLLLRLRAAPSRVWGGDWNHALMGVSTPARRPGESHRRPRRVALVVPTAGCRTRSRACSASTTSPSRRFVPDRATGRGGARGQAPLGPRRIRRRGGASRRLSRSRACAGAGDLPG